MNRLFLCSLAIVAASFLGSAQAQSVPASTQDVLDACSLIDHSDERLRMLSAGMCVTRISGFLEGYRYGADHGALSVFVRDSKALHTVEGIDDLTSRLRAVRKQSRCLPDNYSIDEVVNVWHTYVNRSGPGMGSRHYADTLRDAIEQFYCSE